MKEYLNKITLGDSLELPKHFDAKTVDLILEDMPYNTTQNSWEYAVNLEKYWESRKRLLKPTGVIVLTANQPFTSELVLSNREMFKYDWIWEKSNPTNFLNAKKMPMRIFEDVLVFANGLTIYNPQGLKECNIDVKRTTEWSTDNYGKHGKEYKQTSTNYPKNIIKIQSEQATIHPTQKPVGLFEYLIRTYTNEGDLVFDGFGGSGTTAIAAHRSDRKFIVIEREEKYFALATKRLEEERKQLRLFSKNTA